MRRTTLKTVIICSILVLASTLVFAAPAEKTLGGISLGDPYRVIKARYSLLPDLKKLDNAQLPYPLYVLNKELAKLATSTSLNIVVYLDKRTQKVKALATYEPTFTAAQEYETGAGLRVGDTMQTVRLLYGEPVRASSYVFYFPVKTKIEERIYYYPGLCLRTRMKGDSEVVISMVIGSYDILKTLESAQLPIISKIVTTVTPTVVAVQSPQPMEVQEHKPMATPQNVVRSESVPGKTKQQAWRPFTPKKKPSGSAIVSGEMPVPMPQVTVEIKARPEPTRPKAARTVKKGTGELVEEKIEVSERVSSLSPEFLALIKQPAWMYKIRFEEKSQELVITFRMTRSSLDELKALPEARPYAALLENLFAQF